MDSTNEANSSSRGTFTSRRPHVRQIQQPVLSARSANYNIISNNIAEPASSPGKRVKDGSTRESTQPDLKPGKRTFHALTPVKEDPGKSRFGRSVRSRAPDTFNPIADGPPQSVTTGRARPRNGYSGGNAITGQGVPQEKVTGRGHIAPSSAHVFSAPFHTD